MYMTSTIIVFIRKLNVLLTIHIYQGYYYIFYKNIVENIGSYELLTIGEVFLNQF